MSMYRQARTGLRKVMQRVARRWPDPRLMENYKSLQMRLDSLRLVKNPPEGEGEFACVRPNSVDQRRLFRSGFNIAWIDELGLTPKVIFDIGAYDGGDAVRFKQKFPNARVVSFEADPVRYAIVSDNVIPFDIQAVNAAVSESDDRVEWYQSRVAGEEGGIGGQGSRYRHSPGYRLKFASVQQSATPTTIKSTRIDTFCREAGISEIDLLHVDVEGAEYDVVCGLGSVRPRMIYLETTFGNWIGAKDPVHVHRKLSAMGCILAADLPGNRLYVRADVAGCLS
jgi:FkbM family methyltransferase